MCGTQELSVLGALHFLAGLWAANTLHAGHKEIHLKHNLPGMFVLPVVEIDLLGTVNDFLDVSRVLSYISSNVLLISS